jgi:hypothetical protein
MNTIKATKEYRSQLQGSIERARRRLPTAEFAVVGAGLVAEVGRLDRELEDLQFRALMGCSEGMPLFPRIAQIIQRTCARVELDESPSVSLEKKRVERFPLMSRRGEWSVSFDPPSILMGATVAKNV